MPATIRSSMPCDVIIVCWTLSDRGSAIMPALYRHDETCQHSKGQARTVRKRLASLGRPEIGDLRTRLTRLNNLPEHFWSANETCELCLFLRALATNAADETACDSGRQANSTERSQF